MLPHAVFAAAFMYIVAMVTIRKAGDGDYAIVRDLYYAITDGMQASGVSNSWRHDIYPSQEFIRSAIASDTMYIGYEDDVPVSVMVINREYNEGYEKAAWPSGIPMSDAVMIHALGVLPEFSGRGIAGAMTRYAITEAKRMGAKVLRLDVIEDNKKAEHVYVSVGFVFAGAVKMFYEDTGWTPFRLFEHML